MVSEPTHRTNGISSDDSDKKTEAVFRTDGALPLGYRNYVPRRADMEALGAIKVERHPIYLAEPRQVGKTSLLRRLKVDLESSGWTCAYIDLSELLQLPRDAWFHQVGSWVAGDAKLGVTSYPSDPQSFDDFLLNEVGLSSQSKRLVLLLDEVDSLINKEFSDGFWMMLRSRYQKQEGHNLCFALAGCIDPSTLVRDSTISPFNISRLIHLPDFTKDQCDSLTRHLVDSGIMVTDETLDRVYYWTAGQPYLVQRLCQLLEDYGNCHRDTSLSREQVDLIVHKQLLDGTNLHLRHVVNRFMSLAEPAASIVRDLLARKTVTSWRLGFEAFRLTGAVRVSPDTRQVSWRNPLYERVITEAVGTPSIHVDVGVSVVAQGSLELHVSLSSDQRRLSYKLNSPGGGEYYHQFAGVVDLKASPRELLQSIFDRLSTAARKPMERRSPDKSKQEVEDIAAAIGKTLYSDLIPRELRDEYRNIRQNYRDRGLLIVSDEPWIPWEMVRPAEYGRDGVRIYDDPPLCETFQLSRWFAGHPKTDHLAITKAVLVDPPSTLKFARKEAAFFSNLAIERPTIQVFAALTTVDQVEDCFRAGAAQLIHFACHGNFDLSNPDDSKLRLGDEFLRTGQIIGEAQGGLRRAKPMVFVNACHAGKIGFGLSKLGGWPERFVEAGAKVFIGSLWEINDELASRFAVEFYNRLFGLAGYSPMTLGQAFRAARREIRGLDPANPTWLAYVLYGDPNAYVDTGIDDARAG